jgi:ERCC4-type nuclease
MILIDDRENEKVINKMLMRAGDSQQSNEGIAKVARLDSADYIIGEIGIEAKEINDLYRSILGIGRNRTIVAQLRDLQEAFENPMLVVYGTKLKPWVPGGRPSSQAIAREMARMRSVIKAFKVSFYSRFPKIQYMEFLTMDDFVEFIITTHTNLTISHRLGKAPEEVKVAQTADLDPRVRALSSIRGITPHHAEQLLDKFGTIPKLLNSRTSQKSIMEIPGIGREKARRILSLRDPLTKTS